MSVLRAALIVSAVLPLLASMSSPARAADAYRALVSPGGRIHISRAGREVATITPGLMEATWRGGTFTDAEPGAEGQAAKRGQVRAPGGVIVDTELGMAPVAGGVRLAYRMVPRGEVRLNSFHVSVEFPIDVVRGGAYAADGETGTIPMEFGNVGLRTGDMREVSIPVRGDSSLHFRFASPTPALLQDNRQWGPTFSLRIGPQSGEGRTWRAGEALTLSFDLLAAEGMEVEQDGPVTITAGTDWIPLNVELDIEPGSALDFSAMGQLDAPAGKYGALIVRPDGQLAFERDPATPRRFYGVNLCFSAQYITHEQADRLADRLARIGYNTVRFHHYEGELVDRSNGTSTTLNPEKLDQLDYLFAALKKRGIYMTTDLFVSRPVFAAEIWPGESRDIPMDNFKMAVPVNGRAFENWKEFSRSLLGHVNPHTGLSYARDPAFGWLSMINEGNFGNFLGRVSGRLEQDWQAAWNAFLARKYGNRAAVAAAWGADPGGDPAAGSVPLYKDARDSSPKGQDLIVFLAETELTMFRRMKTFLRDELGTRALLTNMNAWTDPVQNQAVRADYDYVDYHFYVDHPQFLQRSWSLPSRCDNASPVAGGAGGGRHLSFIRLFGKPFTISEYNYSGPGRFRGVGGILTGCMAALQQHSVLWRFAYSHNRGNLFEPRTAGYFDIACDPLNLAAERAAICLYLRGDMSPAPHSVAIAMTTRELADHSRRRVDIAPPWHELALVTRVGTHVAPQPGPVPADIVIPLGWAEDPSAFSGGEVLRADPYTNETGETVLQAMRARGWLDGNVTDLSASRMESETGELLIDAPRDVMVLNTPRTAGCYAPEGQSVEAGPVRIAIDHTDATVWVSSLDGRPIGASRRLLVTHLTDLQNSGARFGEKARQTLYDWGSMPHLVLNGSATVAVRLANPERAQAWALSTGGRRLAPVATMVRDGMLVLPLQVAGPGGARMLYEIEVQ
jgi:hypothetical protein